MEPRDDNFIIQNVQAKKQQPGLSGAVSVLKAELTTRFEKFKGLKNFNFDLLCHDATALGPRFRLLLSEEQVVSAKQTTGLLRSGKPEKILLHIVE